MRPRFSFNLFHLALLCGVLCCLAPTSRADETPVLPLGLRGFQDMGGADLTAVQQEAVRQAAGPPTGEPRFRSMTAPHHAIFEGDFTPRNNDVLLAIFADDGADVSRAEIGADGTLGNWTPLTQKLGVGQALPELAQSFALIDVPWDSTKTYRIRVEYKNLYYTLNTADIDGLTLFAFNGGGTMTDVAPSSLSLESNREAVCAGGWSIAHGYQYLKKDPDGTVHGYVERNTKPDPHIATVTATVKDGADHPLAGQTVVFTWDMPGDAPAKTESKTTDADGKASVDVISGDELSKDTDEETNAVLFDTPVPVKATCLDIEDTKDLDVVAPVVQWQYKNDAGNYVAWNGEDADLYSDTRRDIPLRVELRHDNLPVAGHSISWGFDQVFDKGEAEVLPDDPEYPTYGHMSGAASTTTSDGSATAAFTQGYNFGQIVFQIEDSSVYTHDSLLVRATSARFASTSLRLVATEIPMNKRKKKSRRKSPQYKEYTWVKGIASYDNKWGYPAPPGAERNELLQNTLTLVTQQLDPLGAEYKESGKIGNDRPPTDRRGDPSNPNGWFFSQVVGNDPDSAGYHFTDLKINTTVSGRTVVRRFCAAFDIVINGVPAFEPAGRRTKFGPYVKALRDVGLVAWHRWAGEDRNGDGDLASVQNEIHGIDPAYPFIKLGLLSQIEKFKDKGSGGNDYNAEPTDPDDPFTILDGQVNMVKSRETTKRNQYKEIYSTATAGD